MVMKKIFRSKKGFTLAELLIVIAIIAILAAIAIPTYNNVVEKARQTKDAANMRILLDVFRVALLEEDSSFYSTGTGFTAGTITYNATTGVMPNIGVKLSAKVASMLGDGPETTYVPGKAGYKFAPLTSKAFIDKPPSFTFTWSDPVNKRGYLTVTYNGPSL